MMWTLAQRTGMSHFSAGPPVERWLYEQPIPTMIVLLVLGVLGSYLLRQARKDRLVLLPVLVGLLASTGVWSVAQVVDTDREILRNGTKAFVEAVTAGQRHEARSLLDKDAFLVAAGTEYGRDGDDIADLAAAVPRFIDSHNLRKISTTLDGTNVGRTRYEITIGSGGTPVPMGWELAWRRVGGTWRIVRAECLMVYDTAPQNSFRQWLPRLR